MRRVRNPEQSTSLCDDGKRWTSSVAGENVTEAIRPTRGVFWRLATLASFHLCSANFAPISRRSRGTQSPPRIHAEALPATEDLKPRLILRTKQGVSLDRRTISEQLNCT